MSECRCTKTFECSLCQDMRWHNEGLNDDDLNYMVNMASGGTADIIVQAAKELRELRALLSAPMPCGFERPEALAPGDSNGTHTMGYAAVQHGDCTYDPDEAIALGAALVRAGLQAKGEK